MSFSEDEIRRPRLLGKSCAYFSRAYLSERYIFPSFMIHAQHIHLQVTHMRASYTHHMTAASKVPHHITTSNNLTIYCPLLKYHMAYKQNNQKNIPTPCKCQNVCCLSTAMHACTQHAGANKRHPNQQQPILFVCRDARDEACKTQL